MRGVESSAQVFLWLSPTDMRCGFDRLASLVQEKLSRAVTAGGLFVFFSRCKRRVKILYWDKDGFALWHKRLEAGAFRVETKDGSEEITGLDLEALLLGTELSRIILRKKVEQGSLR